MSFAYRMKKTWILGIFSQELKQLYLLLEMVAPISYTDTLFFSTHLQRVSLLKCFLFALAHSLFVTWVLRHSGLGRRRIGGFSYYLGQRNPWELVLGYSTATELVLLGQSTVWESDCIALPTHWYGNVRDSCRVGTTYCVLPPEARLQNLLS